MAEINGVFIDDVFAKQIPIIMEKVLKKDEDKVLLFDGREGSGKSVLAMQVAKALDPNFSIDKIAFSAEEFIKLLKSPDRKKGDFILLDEAFNSASSRASLTYINRSMIGVATEMRQLNLFVGIVLPSFFDLDKYFALWRCETLFHVYKNKKGDRGQYVIFPFKKKMKLFLKGKKMYNYGCVKSPYPPCKFTKKYVINEDDYRAKKAKAFKTRKVTMLEVKWKERTIKAIKYLYINLQMSSSEVGSLLEITPENVRKIIQYSGFDIRDGEFEPVKSVI